LNTFVKVPVTGITYKKITITCENISVSISPPVTKDDIILILTSNLNEFARLGEKPRRHLNSMPFYGNNDDVNRII